MATIVINSITQSVGGIHRTVSGTLNGEPFAFVYSPAHFTISEDGRAFNMELLRRIRAEWKENNLGAVTLAKMQTLLVGRTIEI